MTTKRTSLFGFLLKTVLVVIGLALTAVLVLNGWGRWELKQARKDFGAPLEKAEGLSVANPTLIAVSKLAEEIQWTKDERITVNTASSLACRDWTPEQFETVQLIVERNTNIKGAVIDALQEAPGSLEATEADQKIFSPILNLIRLLAADGRMALTEGNLESFLKILNVLVTLESELEANPGLSNHILNTAIRNLSNLIVFDGLSWENPDSLNTTSLKQCQAVLPDSEVTEALRSALIGDLVTRLGSFREHCSSAPDGMIKILIHPIFTPIFCAFSEAAMIEQQSGLIELVNRPFGLQTEAFKQPPRPPLWKVHRLLASITIPNLMSTIGRTQAIAAQRQLLDAALTISTTRWSDGAFPVTRPDLPALTEPDPFSGQLLEYRLREDGQLHLAIAGGPKLLKALKMPGLQTWLDPIILDAPAPE
ncbi:MAG: hypothetical protein DRJ61_00660 [Acidobacteria bacterium]|nr:MAG: hypothetical protein DRJ65_01925 [Acidobacteriota bacterium]RLE36483.1 MAG: hypothetical protein DRJ61_00660 [Acidobacteriota bacterium]